MPPSTLITPDNPHPHAELPSTNVPDVAAAIATASSNDFGLGKLKVLGNATAMVVIAFAFLFGGRYFLDQQTTLQAEAIRQANENRDMFREELKALRTDANDRYLRTEATHSKSMEKMGTTIERAVTSLDKATRILEKTVDKQESP